MLAQATKTWASDSDDAKAALAALDEVMAAYKVDAGKQILTGLSMGGSGTWSIAAALPDRFAAIAPICGRGKVETAATIKATCRPGPSSATSTVTRSGASARWTTPSAAWGRGPPDRVPQRPAQ